MVDDATDERPRASLEVRVLRAVVAIIAAIPSGVLLALLVARTPAGPALPNPAALAWGLLAWCAACGACLGVMSLAARAADDGFVAAGTALALGTPLALAGAGGEALDRFGVRATGGPVFTADPGSVLALATVALLSAIRVALWSETIVRARRRRVVALAALGVAVILVAGVASTWLKVDAPTATLALVFVLALDASLFFETHTLVLVCVTAVVPGAVEEAP